MRILLFLCLILSAFFGAAQEQLSNKRIKTLAVKDSIQIDTVSINPSLFSLKTKSGKIIDQNVRAKIF